MKTCRAARNEFDNALNERAQELLRDALESVGSEAQDLVDMADSLGED